MSNTKIIRNLTLTYRGHRLDTNHSQGIRNFMKLHDIPGATQVISLVKAVNFMWVNLMVGDDVFTIESRA